MTPGHRLWKKPILTGDALCAAWWPCPPFTWNNSISLALNLCILTWTTPHGLNVISATPHSTYNVVPGSHWPLSGTSASFALFSAAESFRYRPMSFDYPLPGPPSWIILASVETLSENTCSRFTSVSLVLKMAQKRLCLNGSNGTPAKKQKNQPGSSGKQTQPTTPKSSDTAHHGDLAHKNKKIGLFTAESMRKCIEEVKAVEARQKELGLAKLERSRNQICKEFGIHPSTLSKRMTGKVVGMGSQLGGVRRGRVLTAGEFQPTQ